MSSHVFHVEKVLTKLSTKFYFALNITISKKYPFIKRKNRGSTLKDPDPRKLENLKINSYNNSNNFTLIFHSIFLIFKFAFIKFEFIEVKNLRYRIFNFMNQFKIYN